MMLVAEPVVRDRPRNGAYRWPLRGHTISTINRPISFSRSTNSRIIIRSPFQLPVEARAIIPGFPVFEALVLLDENPLIHILRKATDVEARCQEFSRHFMPGL